jgi:hypothetical protein
MERSVDPIGAASYVAELWMQGSSGTVDFAPLNAAVHRGAFGG